MRFRCPGCGERVGYLLEYASVIKVFKVFPEPSKPPSYVEDVDSEPCEYECPKCGHREPLMRDFVEQPE